MSNVFLQGNLPPQSDYVNRTKENKKQSKLCSREWNHHDESENIPCTCSEFNRKKSNPISVSKHLPPVKLLKCGWFFFSTPTRNCVESLFPNFLGSSLRIDYPARTVAATSVLKLLNVFIAHSLTEFFFSKKRISRGTLLEVTQARPD